MSVEYILILASFVFILMGALIKGPKVSFSESGPKLGARIERTLETGSGFMPSKWDMPIQKF